jgi:hypothetical protein
MKVFRINNGVLQSAEVESIRESSGDCYYCGQPVYTSHGQLIKYKIIYQNGEKKEYPTHKACRKISPAR